MLFQDGATGLWQFMYSTGRMYGLTINSVVDERRDPVKSLMQQQNILKICIIFIMTGYWLLQHITVDREMLIKQSEDQVTRKITGRFITGFPGKQEDIFLSMLLQPMQLITILNIISDHCHLIFLLPPIQ